MEDKKKSPLEDIGLGKAGYTRATVYMDGKAKTVEVERGVDGEVKFLSITGKIFGIF